MVEVVIVGIGIRGRRDDEPDRFGRQRVLVPQPRVAVDELCVASTVARNRRSEPAHSTQLAQERARDFEQVYWSWLARVARFRILERNARGGVDESHERELR